MGRIARLPSSTGHIAIVARTIAVGTWLVTRVTFGSNQFAFHFRPSSFAVMRPFVVAAFAITEFTLRSFPTIDLGPFAFASFELERSGH